MRRLRDYGGHIKAMVALALLVVAGALIATTLTSAYYRDMLEQEREVNRGMFVDLSKQTDGITKRLDDITKRLDGTASTQAATAGKLQDATTAVNEVVDKVDAAAATADKVARAVVVQAAKVAKAIPPAAPAAPPAAVQPEVVNREIRKANEKLKERAGK
jgi:type II secretory pathway component HofQ